MKFLSRELHLKWTETEMKINSPRFYGFEMDEIPKVELVQFVNGYPFISYSVAESKRISIYGLILLSYADINLDFVNSQVDKKKLVNIYEKLCGENMQANIPLQIVLIKVDKNLKLLDQDHSIVIKT